MFYFFGSFDFFFFCHYLDFFLTSLCFLVRSPRGWPRRFLWSGDAAPGFERHVYALLARRRHVRKCGIAIRNQRRQKNQIGPRVYGAQLLQHQNQLNDRYPSSLLYRMATNLCLNRLRDGKAHNRQYECLEDVADPMIQQIALSDELETRSLLDLIFRRHKEGTRTMAILHFVDGMTLEETALEVGLSVSGVRKRLDALRKTARELKAS